MKKYLAYLGLFASIGMLAFVAYVNYDAIVGAFGDGPPYYGRSTNMDKWESPVPILLIVDALTFAVALTVIRWSRRAMH
jgi:hypothetical protein